MNSPALDMQMRRLAQEKKTHHHKSPGRAFEVSSKWLSQVDRENRKLKEKINDIDKARIRSQVEHTHLKKKLRNELHHDVIQRTIPLDSMQIPKEELAKSDHVLKRRPIYEPVPVWMLLENYEQSHKAVVKMRVYDFVRTANKSPNPFPDKID